MSVHLDEPIFNFGEMIEVTGIDAKTFNNWLERDLITLGQLHRTGRRQYSVADCIKIAIISSLSVPMRPGFASAVGQSDVIDPRLREVAALDADHELIHRGYFGKDEPNYLIAFAMPDNANYKVARVVESKLLEAAFGRASVIGLEPVTIVPLDNIAKTIALKASQVLQRIETAHAKATASKKKSAV